MHSAKETRKKRRHTKRGRLLPVPVVALLDVVAAGACLCVFALFHHVLPRVSEYQGTVLLPPSSSALQPETSGEPSSSDTAQTGSEGTSSSQTPDPATGWAAKWPDKFSDTVVKTADSYRSKDISITITRHEETRSNQPLVYFVADIYINRIENLKTGLAKDKFGQGLRESVESMSERLGAVLAINGDYYGNRTVGPVIRNGVLYRESAFEDFCVLYADGVMETYGAQEISMEEVKARGPYQAWSFGPRLLDNEGKAMTEFVSTVKALNPRSAIGYYEPGHYCFVLVEGRRATDYSRGMTMSELSALFESLGCKAAYNLDGGQSSVMTFDGQLYNQPPGGGRANSDMIYIAELG